MKKFAFIILAIILVSWLISGGCARQAHAGDLPPQPKPAIESLTYTNSQYGFSLEYPKDWDMNEAEPGYIVSFTEPTGQSANLNIKSDNLIDYPDVTLKDIRVSYETVLKDRGYQEVNEFTTIISGQPAEVITYTGTQDEQSFKDTRAFLLNGNNLFTISYLATPESYDKYVDCFILVISTYKFTETSTPGDTLSWTVMRVIGAVIAGAAIGLLVRRSSQTAKKPK